MKKEALSLFRLAPTEICQAIVKSACVFCNAIFYILPRAVSLRYRKARGGVIWVYCFSIL